MSDGYENDGAFRRALEDRLKARSAEAGIALARLQRRVTTERLLARFAMAPAGRWVLKGGAALDVRLGDAARTTKDVDLGLRIHPPDGDVAIDMLMEALEADGGDRFTFRLRRVVALTEQEVGDIRRASVECMLAGRTWGTIKIDIAIRAHELEGTELLAIPGSLGFAGIPGPSIETISLPRHVAEKLHALMKTYGERENTRTRDLVDLVLLIEHDVIDIDRTAETVRQVFAERDTPVPDSVPDLPVSWRDVYEASAEEHDIHPRSYSEAVAAVDELWSRLIPLQETT